MCEELPFHPSLACPPRAKPQRNGSGPTMEAVRPVKPLKLRLNGGHRNAQLPCDLFDPQIAGCKVKDLRLSATV